jgi:hypothetical protein
MPALLRLASEPRDQIESVILSGASPPLCAIQEAVKPKGKLLSVSAVVAISSVAVFGAIVAILGLNQD